MESSDQDNKKKYVAVVISAVIVVAVVGAWGFFYFKKKPGGESRPQEVAVKADKEEPDKEAVDKKADVVKAEKVEADKVKTDKVETDKTEAVEEVNIDPEEYAKLKEKVEKSYEEAEGDLAKTSHKYFRLLLGKMAGYLEKAQNADSSQDLAAAYKEYRSLEKMIEESKQSQDDYKEFGQLESELKALVEKVSDRQGGKYAKETFREASVAMGNSDESANTGRFIEAIEGLQKAKDSLTRAMSELNEIVEENWRKGNAALKIGDNVESNAAFVTVKNIDSGYPGIDGAIKRSYTIHIVHPKQQKAKEYEKNGLLEMANSLYREIAGIDPLSQIAQDGVRRTGDTLKTRAINTTIVALNNAMSQNFWEKAKGLLENLKALDPGDERIANYEHIIGNEIDRVKIGQLRMEGAEAEREKEWDVAVKKYEEILIINPDLAIVRKSYERAKKGREYSDAALDAVERANEYSDNDKAGDLKNAVHLLEKVGELYGLKKGLVEEIDALKIRYSKRLKQLEKPVSFTIVSDGKTLIKFWRVGRFDPFTRKDFTLIPGKYSIQGLRNGYREKYINFDVKPIEQNQTLEIVCDEKI